MKNLYTLFILKILVTGALLLTHPSATMAQNGNEFAGGSGTENDPWIIETLDHLNNVRNYTGNQHSNKHFLQNADIDASETATWNGGEGWEPIGFNWSNSFRGNYDGNGHTISGLYINRPGANYQGLFGYSVNASITGTGLIGVDITGFNWVGGLSGYFYSSTLSNSYVTGDIEGNQHVGGLVGYFTFNSTLTNSYSGVNVNGSFLNIGGLVGMNERSVISNCYSIGAVPGSGSIGGLVGSENEAAVSFSFWDTETSNQDNSAGGEGKTTAEMKDFATFILAGWEMKRAGQEGIWNMGNDRNDGYPYLDWQYPEDPPHPDADNNYPPALATNAVSDITTTGATLNGTIWFAGNPVATQHGFCWNTTGMPTTSDSKTEYGEEARTGPYSLVTVGFDPNNIYYVRAYATNDLGTVYGEEVMLALAPEGSGTEAAPYLIESLADLLWIALEVNGGNTLSGKYFSQTADIDASETITWNEGKGWESIGFDWNNSFRGNYNGNGHTIDGLYINRPDVNIQGLFGSAVDASISGIGLTGVDITGNDYVGGLAGYLNNSKISNCSVTGSVEGNDYVGGLAGYLASSSEVNYCYASAGVEGRWYVGGLVGYSWESSVGNSYSTGTVSGSSSLGGLVGYLGSSSINNSYSTGTVSGSSSLGGLVGQQNLATVSFSFWDTETSNQDNSDGGEGKTTAEMKDFATFILAGWEMKRAGLEGIWNMGNDRNDGYPYLDWQYPEDPPHPDAGNDYPPALATNAVSDITTTGATLNGTILFAGNPVATQHGFCWNTTGMPTTGDNKTEYGEVTQTGAFSETIEFAPNTIYYVRVYATSGMETFYGNEVVLGLAPEGSGTEGEPYLIETLADLLWIAFEVNGGITLSGKYFSQTAGIDASETRTWNGGEGWEPIGSSSSISFRGNYDGNGYAIDGLYINRPDDSYQGLFGYAQNAYISDLGLAGVDLTGNDYVGGLAGYLRNTTVNYSYATGSVEGNNYVGGLAGYNFSATVNYSYATGSVEGNNYVGGLAGLSWYCSVNSSYSSGNISGTGYIGGLIGYNSTDSYVINSYSTGMVKGSSHVGGLVGQNWNGFISNSYSTGIVKGTSGVGGLVGSRYEGTVASSYWNTETSGLDNSAMGDGRTTAEMLVEDNFTGWDFVGTWDILEDETYPYLQWQVIPGDHNYPPCSFPDPESLGAENFTSTAADLFWEDDDGDTWNIQWGEKGFMPGRGETVMEITAIPFTLQGLAPFTEYDFWVQSWCGTESDFWTGPFSFTTQMGEVHLEGLIAEDKVYDGGAEAVISDFGTLQGVHADHQVSLVTGGYVAGFDDKDVGQGKTVTVTGLDLEGDDAGRYIVGNQTTTAEITPKELGVINAVVQYKVYDGTTNAEITGAELDGVVIGDNVTLAEHTAGVFGRYTVGEDIPVTVNMEITGTDAGNYSLVQPELFADINPRPLVIIPFDIKKPAGTVYEFAGYEFNTEGLIGSDEVSSVTLESAGAVEDAEPGSYDINAADATGSGLANYDITYETGTMEVTILTEVTVSVLLAENKEYDGTADAFIYGWGALEGVKEGDVVTLETGAHNARFSSKLAGTGKTVIISGLSLTGADANEYFINHQTTIADITPKELTITGSFEVSDKTYDGAKNAVITDSQLELTGVLAGDDVVIDGIVAEFVQADVGENLVVNILSAGAGGLDGVNYTVSVDGAPTTTASITRRDASITAEDKTKVYGSDDPEFTVSYSGLAPGEDASVFGGNLLITREEGEDAGSYELTPSGLTSGNYNITFINGTLAITPAALTITAEDESKVYGDDDPGFTLSYTGFRFDDDDGDLDGTLSFTREAGESVGSYLVTPSGLTSGNYAITWEQGTLSITVKEIGIGGTFTAEDKMYDGTTVAIIKDDMLTLEGVVGNDDVILADVEIEFASADAGDDLDVYIVSASLEGEDAGNYTLSLDGAPTATASILEIVEYTLTVTIEGEGSVKVNEEAYTDVITVEQGTEMTLEAIADEGWEFDGWSGDLVSENAGETITMDSDKAITAVFTFVSAIEPVTAGEILIYPNPFDDHIIVENARFAERIYISNLTGQTVMVVRLTGNEREVLRTESLARGVYLLIIENADGERKTIRMIKE